MHSEFDDDFDEGSSTGTGPIRNKTRTKKDQNVLREESKNRQKLLRAQMKDLFRELASVIRPPLDPNHEKTKAILQRAIEYIQQCNQSLDAQRVTYSPLTNSSPLSHAHSSDTSPFTSPPRESEGHNLPYDMYMNPVVPQFFPSSFPEINDFNIQNLAGLENNFFPYEDKTEFKVFEAVSRGVGDESGRDYHGFQQVSRGITQIGSRGVPQQEMGKPPLNQPPPQHYPQQGQFPTYQPAHVQHVPPQQQYPGQHYPQGGYPQPNYGPQAQNPGNYQRSVVPPNFHPSFQPQQPQSYDPPPHRVIPFPPPPGMAPPQVVVQPPVVSQIGERSVAQTGGRPLAPTEKPLEEQLKGLSVADGETEEEVIDAILSLEEPEEDTVNTNKQTSSAGVQLK